jgi:Cu(I)/Ag(I) efflux system membrane fusion protein
MKAEISINNIRTDLRRAPLIFSIISIFLILLISCSKKKVEEDPNIFYTCSMDPQVMEKKPGKCPICKMELTKTVVSPDQDKESIKLSETQIKLGNITTRKAERGQMGEEINLRGIIVPDERKINSISSRVSGRVETLLFKNPGEAINIGDHIYDIYSEELQAVIKQYLLLKEKAMQLNGGNINYAEMLKTAKDKLIVWGISENQVSKLNQSNSSDLIPFYSKVRGIVNEVLINEGDYVNEGASILQVADYSALWVEAEVYPEDMKVIKTGLKVNVVVEAYPDEITEGKISFENPELETQSRFNLVRIEIANTEGKYKPGMRVTVTALLKENNALTLPEEAILYQSDMNTVWVAKESGLFIPKMVETGITSNGRVEIKSGITDTK